MKVSLLIFLVCCNILYANLSGPVFTSQISVHTYYSEMIECYESNKWKHLAWKCEDLITEFPTSPFSKEALYYLGIAQYKLGEYQSANSTFSNYLKEELTPKFFEQTIRFKFEIATEFDNGHRTHLFGWKKMPKWLPSYETAIEIYDEVITTLPRDDLAALSLYRKGQLLIRIKDYKSSVDAFQTLYRRFPKHGLAPDAYIGVLDVYLTESKKKFPDSHKLELAEITLKEFRLHFPQEPRIDDAEKKLLEIKEELGRNLLEIAEFYRRTKKKKAAIIYYKEILAKYSETNIAKKSKRRLQTIDASHL